MNQELTRDKKIAEMRNRLETDFYVFSEQNIEGTMNEYREAQEDITFLLSELERLQQDRKKLIEVLKYAEAMLGPTLISDTRTAMAYTRICDTLKSIGVEIHE